MRPTPRRIRAVGSAPGTVSDVLSRSVERPLGFSFVELLVTLTLLGIVAAIGSVTFSYLRGEASGFAAGPLLGSVQLEARRLAETDGTFPEGIVTDLSALSGDDISYVTSAASASNEVSVQRVDDVTMVFAAPVSGGCLVLVDRPFATSTWARFTGEALACNASTLSPSALGLDRIGSASSPQEVTL